VEEKGLTKLLFLAAALSLLSALVRRERNALLWVARARTRKVNFGRRRIATSLVFATLFFAGAALSAGAGNGLVTLIPGESSDLTSEQTTSTQTTADDGAAPAGLTGGPSDDAAQDDALAPVPSGAAQQSGLTAGPQSSDADSPAADPQASAPDTAAPASSGQSELTKRVQSRLSGRHAGSRAQAPLQGVKRKGRPDPFHGAAPVLQSQPKAIRREFEREPEADEPNVNATIWLQRALPDPTPPSRRLKPGFAHRLARISARNHVDWALTLAVLRASGERGAVPASTARLKVLAKRLAVLKAERSAWSSALALNGHTTFADRTLALRNLYRAVGMKALVRGFEWAKPSLSKRILSDRRISIYPGGRADIEAGRVNIRVLVLIAYLAEAHGQVTVSCLISGHRLYARPGVISAHIFGLAADISTLGGTSIFGHQQPGSVTEHAVRNILLLPSEMQPRQVISLIGMGGPSFPLANHDDHIHVGF
jgi:hypothetical protein